MKNISRRDFVKLIGASAGALLMTRCRTITSCYMPLPPPSETPFSTDSDIQRLHELWYSFSDLAEKTRVDVNGDDAYYRQMVEQHRERIEAVVSRGLVSAPAAELVQDGYEAAVYHVWRSNAPMTCYEPVMVDYAPVSAEVLLTQAEELARFAQAGDIPSETIEKARTAIEHDMAFYEMNDQEMSQMYEKIREDLKLKGVQVPSFEDLEFEISPDVKEATEFMLRLLVGS